MASADSQKSLAIIHRRQRTKSGKLTWSRTAHPRAVWSWHEGFAMLITATASSGVQHNAEALDFTCQPPLPTKKYEFSGLTPRHLPNFSVDDSILRPCKGALRAACTRACTCTVTEYAGVANFPRMQVLGKAWNSRSLLAPTPQPSGGVTSGHQKPGLQPGLWIVSRYLE